MRSRGDLLSLTGKPDKATDAYDEAEKLFRAVHDDLGLANVLRSRGDLLSLTGEPEKAMTAYDEAEKLFRAVHDDLGLANVLKSRGDLLRQTGEPEKATDAYDEAEKLFKAEHDDLGLANVIQGKGDQSSCKKIGGSGRRNVRNRLCRCTSRKKNQWVSAIRWLSCSCVKNTLVMKTGEKNALTSWNSFCRNNPRMCRDTLGER